MTTLDEGFNHANLVRAWRWIRSNPDASYKEYFRDGYSRYALADEQLLDKLHRHLVRGIYEPRHATKLRFPKRSGILRPYTLLTVEDQIVYQAMINVVAEHLYARVRFRYYVEVFGHLYAGKNSRWFYRKWSHGYSQFNQAAREAYAKGLRFTASFDLTAYYDSLDHNVLRHFLKRIGCDEEFCLALTNWLSIWTSADRRIYHGHGIPQGPLGSGLLSEVVLQHLDVNYRSAVNIRYLRYVDDIRLFAKSEVDLRRMVVRLDTLSKEIGLFPQSSKIAIHEVKNIEDELKSVSNPTEASVQRAAVDQIKLRRRLTELTPRFQLQVQNESRFKYLLAHAAPSARLNRRLWRIYDQRPDLYGAVMRYFQRYKTLPRIVGERVIAELGRLQLYPAMTTALLETAQGRLRTNQKARVDRIVRKIWKPRSLQPDLMAAVGKWVITEGLISAKQIRFAVSRSREGWVRSQLVTALNDRSVGRTLLSTVLNERLRDDNGDVAIAGAVMIARYSIPLSRPLKGINESAGAVLRQLGLLRRVPRGSCGVELSMTGLLGGSVRGINWRLIFGPSHRQAEKQAVWCRAWARTDARAFVNGMDVFNDLLLATLYLHDRSLGRYTSGKIGSMLSSTRLKAKYPDVLAMVSSIHKKRYQSMLSHAKIQKTGKPTGQIKFSYLLRAKRLMVRAFTELAKKW